MLKFFDKVYAKHKAWLAVIGDSAFAGEWSNLHAPTAAHL